MSDFGDYLDLDHELPGSSHDARRNPAGDRMTAFLCRDCGHSYGAHSPSYPVIALHRAVSHSVATPIVELSSK